MKNKIRPFFKHLVIEVKLEKNTPDSVDWIKEKTSLLLDLLKLKKIKDVSHKFSPRGISFITILSSSHMAVHSWPENNYLHIDLVSCTKNLNEKGVKSAAEKIFLRNVLVHKLSY